MTDNRHADQDKNPRKDQNQAQEMDEPRKKHGDKLHSATEGASSGNKPVNNKR
jgi:hypothetical protein